MLTNIFLWMLVFSLFKGNCALAETKNSDPNEGMELAVKAQEQVAVPLLLAVVGDKESNQMMVPLAGLLKKAFEFSGEMKVTVRNLPLPTSKRELKALEEEGFMLVVYLMYNIEKNSIEWRLYDPSEQEMLVGKSYTFTHDELRWNAYQLADCLWPELSGNDGFFSTQIAYCVKAEPLKQNGQTYQHIKHIYISDYDGSNPVCIVDRPTLNIAPRWGRDPLRPSLYYSRCTASNMQLVELEPDGRKRVVLNADGLNMLPSFSPSSNGVAYNYDGEIMLKRIDPDSHGIVYTKVTNNDGNNVSPNLLDNGDVIFCSDFKTKNPQIYYYHAQEMKTEAITDGGFCCSPSYCPVSHKVVYTKLIKGVAQLFLYDLLTKTHEQITFDGGHKDEPSFSPCGNLVAFSVEKDDESRIVVMHLGTRERHLLTPKGMHASYASWSGRSHFLPSFK